jgi:hypothetical protein
MYLSRFTILTTGRLFDCTKQGLKNDSVHMQLTKKTICKHLSILCASLEVTIHNPQHLKLLIFLSTSSIGISIYCFWVLSKIVKLNNFSANGRNKSETVFYCLYCTKPHLFLEFGLKFPLQHKRYRLIPFEQNG